MEAGAGVYPDAGSSFFQAFGKNVLVCDGCGEEGAGESVCGKPGGSGGGAGAASEGFYPGSDGGGCAGGGFSFRGDRQQHYCGADAVA